MACRAAGAHCHLALPQEAAFEKESGFAASATPLRLSFFSALSA